MSRPRMPGPVLASLLQRQRLRCGTPPDDRSVLGDGQHVMLVPMTSSKRVGILCGGGPAPGINSVIGAATIRSVLGGADVLGIHGGFRRLMQRDLDCATG